MLAKAKGYALHGLEGIPINVEVDINNGLPAFNIVGLADTAVKEASARVCSAVKNSGQNIAPLLNSTLYRVKWSASSSGCFTPWKKPATD